MNGFAVAALILLALTGNILWYWLKHDLKNKGYKVNNFQGHFNDLQNASKVIRNSDGREIKHTYRWVLSSLIAVFILMPTVFFTNIELTGDWRCRRFNNYLEHEVNGVIDSKYIDKPNHAMKTLNLADGTKEDEITIFATGLYEFLQPGDSIYKISGNSELEVFRSGELTTFNVSQTDYCGE